MQFTDFTRAIESPTNPDFPAAADRLYGRICNNALPLGFFYELRKVTTPAKKGKPGKPAIPQVGEPGDPDFQPAVAAVPPVPPTAEISVPLCNGNIDMTQEQWDAWTTQPDDEYVPQCVADNLGLTLSDE